MKYNQSANNSFSSNVLSSFNYKKQKDDNHLTSEIYSKENKEAFSISKYI